VNRIAITLAVAVLAAGAAAAPASAQKVRPGQPTTGPDADRDGVGDAADRCPNTPAGRRVGPDGCPVTLVLPGAARARPAPAATQPGAAAAVRTDSTAAATPRLKGRRPSPVLIGRPGAPPTQGAAAQGAAARPGLVAPQGAQAVAPAAALAPAAATAGFSVEPPSGEEEADALLGHARDLAQLLDSAIVTLVGVFRNTAGQPVAGATAPSTLSQRERDRWSRCRDIHWDLLSYPPALQPLREGLEDNSAVTRALAALDSALLAQRATDECDNVTSMIAAPERWTPWQQQYETAARHFYRDWYGLVREVHEKNRQLVAALNGALPADRRLPVPAGLPRTPPYAGAGPR